MCISDRYIIGAVLLFAARGVLGFIQDFSADITGSATTTTDGTQG